MTEVEAEHRRRSRWRPGILGVAAVVFVAICLPVVVRGAPLADDFANCLGPMQDGLASSLAQAWERLGVVRPAHLLEVVITSGVCQRLPFGFAIAVPLTLTLVVAVLLRGLLRDLGAPEPWPDVGGALWLLQPLGTEAALWPAALHVPLGLALGLAAVRLHHRGRHGWGVAAALGAFLSTEQLILALPLGVWLVTPADRRRSAVAATGGVAVVVLAAFAMWPGSDPRLAVSLTSRLSGLFADPFFYVAYPAVGLGLHSIPLALWWAFPLSLLLVAAGGILGWRTGPGFVSRTHPLRPGLARQAIGTALLVASMNVPVLLSAPLQGSPRIFTPTWLVLAAAAALVGPALPQRRAAILGAVGGAFLVGAALSLTLSVWVRLHSAEFTEESSARLAVLVPDGGVVAVCGVRRTVVQPAPYGAFAIHELVYDWAARDALYYYTGERATFRLAGELWDRPCPKSASGTVVRFDGLLTAAGLS